MNRRWGPFFSLKRLTAADRRGMRAATITTGLLIAFGLLLFVSAIHVSSTPSFCGSCHVMESYYDSWAESSHKEIACVECHIPPGISAEFRKKYEALAMVARYFTKTYSTNPWAEVDDTACLRCHERRLIQGREVFHNALFDHKPHLTEMRRGMKLRCTSCHSQMVQGSHMTVTTSTCVLCHFKNQTPGHGTADCAMCHDPPDHVIDTANLQFDHGDVNRFGMECVWCHEHVAEGSGNVLRERCFTCHKTSVRLEHFEDPALLHEIHVTEHKVDCMHCHLEIQHHGEPEAVRQKSDCNRCHASGSHSAQRDLYAGIGAKGVPPNPNPMFVAGVRCEGCHVEEGPVAAVSAAATGHGAPDDHALRDPVHGAAGATVARADEVSCMACHGPGYYSIFQNWQSTIDARLSATQRQMQQTAEVLAGREAEPEEAWPATWSDARDNLSLIERGHGIHNVDYSQAVLQATHDQMNEVRAAVGQRPLAQPWVSLAPGCQPCMSCHLGIEQQAGRFAGRRFSHAPHLEQAGLDCLECHRPHDERPPDELVRFDRNRCNQCHHQQVKTDCISCHADLRGREIAVDLGAFSHELHLDDVELTCDNCHGEPTNGAFTLDRDTCSDCHD